MNLLAPQPMTAKQIADLVERTRLAEVRIRAEAVLRAAHARSVTIRANYRMTPCRIVAHLAKLTGWSIPMAVRVYNETSKRRQRVSHGGAWHAFRRIYPHAVIKSGARSRSP